MLDENCSISQLDRGGQAFAYTSLETDNDMQTIQEKLVKTQSEIDFAVSWVIAETERENRRLGFGLPDPRAVFLIRSRMFARPSRGLGRLDSQRRSLFP